MSVMVMGKYAKRVLKFIQIQFKGVKRKYN